MKVTVCELHDESDLFIQDWNALCKHVKDENSQLVVLPEMVFAPWFAIEKQFSAGVWKEAVQNHDDWINRKIGELAPAIVAASRPINKSTRRLNEAFLWNAKTGYSGCHEKYYLPDEEGFWEASWYQRGDGNFNVVHLPDGTGAGFLICTELWFMERARSYGKHGAQLILSPRATGKPTVDKWLVGGRADAVVSGAYSLSSNRYSASGDLGGGGWIISPDGDVLAKTTQDRPFISLDIDPTLAEKAKNTYPRYVIE